MAKRSILMVAAVILVLAVLEYYRAKKSHVAPAPTLVQPAAPEAKTSFRQLKDQAIPKQELTTAVETLGIPAECSRQWQTVSTGSLQQLFDDMKRGALKLDPICRDREPKTDILKTLYDACVYEPTRGFLKDEKDCLTQLALYRAFWIDQQSQDQKDFRNMSMQLLANKIFVRFQQAVTDPSKRAELQQMIGALLEREPQMADAHKALVAVKMFELGTPNYSADEMRAATAKALALNPGDSQLTEASLLNEQMSNHPEAIAAYVAQNPDSGLGYYYRAWDSWHAGDHAAAIADLQRAARLLPGDQRIAKTLGDAERNHGGDVFSVTVGFNLGDL